MDATFFIGLITLAVLKSAPLVFGALCGLLGERSGVINIGIEGMMLLGAFFAFLTRHYSTNGRVVCLLRKFH
jgi:ABC-type uncharacterized transport system permease subunit